jgi:hypothetical protein
LRVLIQYDYIIIKKLGENQKQQHFIAHSKVFATDSIVGEASPHVIASVSGHPLVAWIAVHPLVEWMAVLWVAALVNTLHRFQIALWISKNEFDTIICN